MLENQHNQSIPAILEAVLDNITDSFEFKVMKNNE